VTRFVPSWLFAAGVLLAGPSFALQITSLSPQGEVARVRQIVAKFDQAAVNFGDPKAPAPLTVSCSDAQAGKGTGRWTDAKAWVYDFENDLPPGVRCTLTRIPTFKPSAGGELTGPERYQFNTGGPFVRSYMPGSYSRIDEQQMFVLELNGAATLDSVRQNIWCAADGVGERIPVKLLDGDQRAGLLKAFGRDKAAEKDPLRFVALQCNRTLTPGAKVQVVYGKGVATPSGVANNVERRLEFQVREPFAVSFSCERENAQAACLPLRPMQLQFNAPVTRKLAAQIQLKGGDKTVKAKLDNDGGTQSDDDVVSSVSFEPPLAESTQFSIELPARFEDASGRPLASPGSFPLKVATGMMPPLAKFAASPFGVVERLAEPDTPAMMPVTVRRVEPQLMVNALTPGKVSDMNPKTDAEIIAWFRKVRRYDSYSISREQARKDVKGPLPPVIDKDDRTSLQTRMLSLLAGQPGVKALDMPKSEAGDPRPFEVIGIPLTPGFHVLEIASQKLGEALLDERYNAGRTMYVRTTALATNLAVHFKLGRENSMAWVTSLDKGKVVAGAEVRVSSCDGKAVATGTTDANGIVMLNGISPQAPSCNGPNEYDSGAWFVSARAKDDKGVEDLAFTWSDWQRGIEPWRFNVPTNLQPEPDRMAHTIFDRTLLRAGETVSMKSLIRTQTSKGFGLPEKRPDTLVITHTGSGQRFTQPLNWRKTATGGLSAENSFAIPPAAKLGVYEVMLRTGAGKDANGDGDNDSDGEDGGGYSRSFGTGTFRVEEFRLPVLEGRIAPTDKKPLVAATSVPTDVQINYVAGGGAANLPVRVSAMVRGKALSFSDYDAFSFNPPRATQGDGTETAAASDSNTGEEDLNSVNDTRVIADKLAVTLNKDGAGKLTIDKVPKVKSARELLLEATYADPNGEVQTIRSTQTLWPASVIAGIKTEGWVSTSQKLKFQALALDLSGKPQAGVTLNVRAVARITTSSRKRMVGGFYTYDNKTETKDIGTVCSGKSDARGLLLCESELKEAGEVELIASATDSDGRDAKAVSSVYVTRQGELWFGGEDNDRIDVLPEKKSYQPGEVAKFQVRSPFRFATALVAVEREGIIETHVVQLDGKDPTVTLQVKPEWGPNAYVSVLALRGRLREVPWYSFFTWGFKSPREWWTAFWYEGKEYVAPTAMVDLSKPAYRLGMAEIRVGTRAHQLDVTVTSDKPSYPIRSKAQVTITAKLPDGKPAVGAEVALAAVDQALLELMPNDSWNLLNAMLQRRSWGVSTSTAQMEIVGRRHYGRKAVPAGGGGGKGQTRELLDTLLVWNPKVVLDANGQAVVTVPLNDALTTFKIVAVADSGTSLFGTGQTSIQATQDLQIISGLPPLVREDDQFRAQITLRNTTQKPMKVEATPRATLLTLEPQTVDIPAGEAREVAWTVTAPAQLAQTRAEAILWEIEAKDTLGGARDALKVRQRIVPSVPLTVQQATLVQIDGPFTLDVAPPADALPGRGGLKMSLQPKLAEGLPGVRDWFANYPFICLEQKTSKSVGLRDAKMWQGVLATLPTYLDSDGLANYFPPRDGEANRGSDILTSYLLAATNEAVQLEPRLRAGRRPARADGIGPDRLCRRPHHARVLEPAQGPGRAQARRARGALALRQGQGQHAGQHHHRAQPVAHQRGDRLAQHPEARERRAAAPAAPGGGQQRAEGAPVLPGHQAHLQYRAGRLLVVAHDQRRRQHRAAAAQRDGRPGLEGRHRQAGQRLHRPPAERRLAHHHRQPVGRTGAGEVQQGVREHAGHRHHRGHAGRGEGAGRLEPRRAREDQRRRRRAQPDHLLRRARLAGQPEEQHDVPAVGSLGFGRPGARHAAGDAARHRQAVAHAAVDCRRAAEGAVRGGLRHQEDHHPGRAGHRRQVHARRRAARDAGGERQRRHDLGGDQRPGSGRRHHPGQRPGPRLADRHAGREEERLGLAGFRGAQLRGLPQLLRVPAQGRGEDGIHRAPEQRRRLRAAAEPRRGDVRARDVRRSPQCAREGGGGEVSRGPRIKDTTKDESTWDWPSASARLPTFCRTTPKARSGSRATSRS
jgi:hypothetical protein